MEKAQEKICLVKSNEPFEYTLSMMGGKWRLKILYVLTCLSIARYGELKKNMEGITHKVLSEQLDDLEKKGIIRREEYPQIPPKVEYSFTEKGKTLIPLIYAMCDWGEENKA